LIGLSLTAEHLREAAIAVRQFVAVKWQFWLKACYPVQQRDGVPENGDFAGDLSLLVQGDGEQILVRRSRRCLDQLGEEPGGVAHEFKGGLGVRTTSHQSRHPDVALSRSDLTR